MSTDGNGAPAEAGAAGRAGAAEGWRERLRSVAVLGAGGKMGSGIAWVALAAMADLDAQAHGAPGSGEYELVLIDPERASFGRLRAYLREQARKRAERSIVSLREWAADQEDLVENGEIIGAYVDGALSMVRCAAGAAEAAGARLVFEAVFEDLDLKRRIYEDLKARCAPDAVFLTNTSSIPIALLDEGAGLEGRLLGFHFYNPPAVQKLVELIPGRNTRPEITSLGRDLGKAFGKTVVPARDVAGFIGNGHFIRECLFALGLYRELAARWSGAEAWYILDKVTRDFLIRPMGMAQLMDYVGLEVVGMIAAVMRAHLPSGGAAFADATLAALLAAGVKGGQRGSGEQKDGLLHYAGSRPAGVLDADPRAPGPAGKAGAGQTGQIAAGPAGTEPRYVSLDEPGRFAAADAWIGPLPEGWASWTHMSRDPERSGKIAAYLEGLARADGNGARLARAFLDHSRAVARGLTADGVAASDGDVDQVLKLGFFHLYGPSAWGKG